MASDLERKRIEALLRRVRSGVASDADREELVLHGVDIPDPATAVPVSLQTGDDARWMDRVYADEKLLAAERTPWTRAERRVGVAMVLGGAAGAFMSPPVGTIVAVAGGALLFASVLRVKLLTLGKDPYDEIKR